MITSKNIPETNFNAEIVQALRDGVTTDQEILQTLAFLTLEVAALRVRVTLLESQS